MKPVRSTTQTPHQRTNTEWLAALRSYGPEHDHALADLRTLLLQAVLVYLRRHRNKLHSGRNELLQLAGACAEEALILIESRLETFRDDSRFTTWAYRMAVKVATGELHSCLRENLTLDSAVDTELKLPMRYPVNSSLPVADREMIETLSHLIPLVLTDEQQKALAFQIRGMPLDVIAERFDTNSKALYRVLHDTRRQLKQALLDVHETQQRS